MIVYCFNFFLHPINRNRFIDRSISDQGACPSVEWNRHDFHLTGAPIVYFIDGFSYTVITLPAFT